MKAPVASRRLLQLAGLALVAAVAASIWPALLPPWEIAISVLLLAALADLAVSRALPARLELERRIPASLAIGRWRDCVVRLHNRGTFAARCNLYDHVPESTEIQGLPFSATVPPGGFVQAMYRMKPTERGLLTIDAADVRVGSPFGLWEIAQRVGDAQRLRCYPDFAELADYALFAVENRLSRIGVLHRRRRGEGLEFHQLRDHRHGDSLRQIDWKATSRRGKLIAREYEDERDQQIVFLIDCGRRMMARDGTLSHFDETLNAVLLLAFVALRQGDAAGLMTFAGESPRFVPPRKSHSTVNLFLNALYDVQPTLRPPDYYAAAVDLSRRLKRRSLVIVLSNLRDEDEETIAPALALLRRKHLVLFANLREAALDRLRERPVRDLESALAYAAGAVYERDRNAVTRRVQSQGAVLLDTLPQDLAVSLVNRYLDLKRSGRF